MKKRWVSPAQYRREKYGLYGAFSIVSALAIAGLLAAVNLAGIVLSALAHRR